MDRRTTRRLVTVGLLMWAVAVLAGAMAAPAWAQPTLVQVTVTGPGLTEPLVILAEDEPERAAAMYAEVSWLVGRESRLREPDPDTLGPLYAIEVFLDGQEGYRFHLFPLAEGGPRAFRPAEQPADRTVEEGWFFGRLGMPDVLEAVGVPLSGEAVGGGTGGGEPIPGVTTSPDRHPLAFLDEWHTGLLGAGLVAVLLLAGVASVAYLVRHAT